MVMRTLPEAGFGNRLLGRLQYCLPIIIDASSTLPDPPPVRLDRPSTGLGSLPQ